VKQVNEPPVVLVKTWISLVMSSEDNTVKQHAKEMLLNAFGDMSAVAVYAEKHQIKIRK
jgi:hypothetical protein